ncbi:MAG TPA: IPExxxVDY family protein [Tenacibaculum sp.]|nr:IPExxxVDY family protein [Tenacibaculum sp.]
MTVYELDFDDFSSCEYSLLAIHTPLEDYKLAYLLNRRLDYKFKKSDINIDKKNKNDVLTSFSVYEYSNAEHNFSLIKNTLKKKVIIDNDSLFNVSHEVSYLISERKKVDYFLKIEGDINAIYLSKLIQKLKAFPQLLTSYKIDINSLKSKDFLIF